MFDYERIGKIFVDHKNKCYIWLKIETLNEMLIFVGRCYIPQHDYTFYARVDRDQPFVNLKDDIAFSKAKGEVVVFGDMTTRT